MKTRKDIQTFGEVARHVSSTNQDVIHNFIEPALPKAFLNLPMPNVPFLGKQVK